MFVKIKIKSSQMNIFITHNNDDIKNGQNTDYYNFNRETVIFS